MAEAKAGQRSLVLDNRQVEIWANKAGVFLGCTDPDFNVIVALKGKPKQAALAALRAHGRKTD
jgi:hypothetical protein